MRFLTLYRHIRAVKMVALLKDHHHTGQTSIFMNYVAIKESVLRRCSLVIAGGTSFHNEYYVAVRVCEGR